MFRSVLQKHAQSAVVAVSALSGFGVVSFFPPEIKKSNNNALIVAIAGSKGRKEVQLQTIELT